MQLLFGLALLFACAFAIEYTETALQNEIKNLPGAPPLNFRQFSGYISLPNGHGKIFYWFVESQGNPDSDPLMLWTNGGPGCSGLAGLMTENGPFRPNKDGTLDENKFSWNKIANMVFVEQPVGVGFSQASGDIQYGDSMAALDNHLFLEGFLDLFPAFKTKALYLTSESYGGHYLPTLAKEIVTQGKLTHFAGFAVGNPLTWMPYRDYGQWGTLWGHQLIPQPLWTDYLENKCQTLESSRHCQSITDQMSTITQDLDPYALDFPVCLDESLSTGRAERWNFMNIIRRSKRLKGQHKLNGFFPEVYEPCADVYADTYLNRKDIQAAIGADEMKWQECNDEINQGWNATDLDTPMMPIYEFLVNNHNLNLMVYSGTDDSVCATLGSQQFIWDTFNKTNGQDWSPWKDADGQIAGSSQGFDGFRFTTVNGAGHMVPSTRPAQSLEMLRKYLDNEW